MALIKIDRSYASDSEDLTGDIHDCSANLEKHSFGENYLAVRGAAVILSNGECFKSNLPNHLSGSINEEIKEHLHLMIQLIRPQDYIKLAARLEQKFNNHSAYLTIVATGHNSTPTSQKAPFIFGQNKDEISESLIIGIDIWADKATIGLVLSLRSDSRVELDGDGGFNYFSDGKYHNFKPISVQTMWSSYQYLIKEKELVNQGEKLIGSKLCSYYESNLKSDPRFILAWHENPETIRNDDQHFNDSSNCDIQLQKKIRLELKRIMMTVDLEEVTSKYLRTRLEDYLQISLTDMKRFINDEMIIVMRQMESPSKIFDFLYLGSEWNASNLEELLQNGVGSILNVTREIANFYPETFKYKNVYIFDDEEADLLKHLNDTHRFISKAKSENTKILVHCKMGISRSASTVIAFVMKELNMSYLDALKFVREKRNCIQPNKAFKTQLETYGGILEASKQRDNSLWHTKFLDNLDSFYQNLSPIIPTENCRKKNLRCKSFHESPKKSVENFFRMNINDSKEDLEPNKLSPSLHTVSLKKAASFCQYTNIQKHTMNNTSFDELKDFNLFIRPKSMPVYSNIDTNQNYMEIKRKNKNNFKDINIPSCSNELVNILNLDKSDNSSINMNPSNFKINTQGDISLNNCSAFYNKNLTKLDDSSASEKLCNVPSNSNNKDKILKLNTQENFYTEYFIPEKDISINAKCKVSLNSECTNSICTKIAITLSESSKFITNSSNNNEFTKSGKPIITCTSSTSISPTNSKYLNLNKEKDINPKNYVSKKPLEEIFPLNITSCKKLVIKSDEVIKAKNSIHRAISYNLSTTEKSIWVPPSEYEKNLNNNCKISLLQPLCDNNQKDFLEYKISNIIKLKKTKSDPVLSSKNNINYIESETLSNVEYKNNAQDNFDSSNIVKDKIEIENFTESIAEQIQYVIAKPFPNNYIPNAISKMDVVPHENILEFSSPNKLNYSADTIENNKVKDLLHKFSGKSNNKTQLNENEALNHLKGNKIFENLKVKNYELSVLSDENNKMDSKFSPLDSNLDQRNDNKSLYNSKLDETEDIIFDETNNLRKTWSLLTNPKRRIQNNDSKILSKINFFDNDPSSVKINSPLNEELIGSSCLQESIFSNDKKDIFPFNSDILSNHSSDWMCNGASPHYALQLNNSYSNLNRCN